MVAWLAAAATALIACCFTTWRRPGRNLARGLWTAALGALPGSPLMIAHALAFAKADDDFVPLALFGVIFGPIAFLESGRVAPPLRVPAYVDAARLLLLTSWAATSFSAAMAAIYI